MTDKGHHSNSLQGTSSPPPCANGCGFFGSPSTMNMCSKCFRESVKSKPAPSAATSPSTSQSDSTTTSSPTIATTTTTTPPSSNPTVVAPNPVPALPLPPPPTPPSVQQSAPSSSVPTQLQPQVPPQRKVQKNTSRCFSCRKKVGLTGFKCHCGYVYCSEHRYSEAHDCDYDYQTSGREQLAKANPVVVASKLDKI